MQRKLRHSLLVALILVTQFISVNPSLASNHPQVQTTEDLANETLERMTPEERIGQLFVVDFDGNNITEDSPIYSLISQYHIGGVQIKGENGNLISGENALLNTWAMIEDLQRTEISTSRQFQTNPTTGETFNPVQVPLFIAISQGGDGYPTDQLLEGLTPLPSQMAIGATWDANMAQTSGEILGQELSALGINMLLGPTLDVHGSPRPELAGDLGVNSFSGSSYWVGELGSAFITGVHEGSDNRMAVISKNFPSYTGADRPLNEEIPAIRKTLEQLLLTELPPFFTVTDLSAEPEAITDGLLLNHTRYQAFQSNISTTTPPITLDSQALNQLLSLQGFSNWHANGGLLVSSELGTQAIRRYYTQIGEKYNPKFLARDVFLAGSDLILTGNILAPDDADIYISTVSMLDFFAQKYRDDLAFAQQVDEAVLRILMLKYSLYNNSFAEENILGETSDIDGLGSSSDAIFELARAGATLIDPAPENLNNVLPNPPSENDFITIFTDVIDYQACEDCEVEEFPAFNELETVATRLYGPAGDGLIVPGNVASYTFGDLDNALDQLNDPENLVVANISRSEWLVFLQQDVDTNRPESLALSRFLSETPELLQGKKIVVFALNAPYFLTATEISTVSAFYGLYSKQPQFIEVAARILFQEVSAPGAAPVSINGVGYVLEQVTTPDPSQIIPISISRSGQVGENSATPLPETYMQGDSMVVSTGEILDYNGNPVPDETVVRFTIVTTNQEGGSSQRELTSLTTHGVARVSFLLDTPGAVQVQASSGEPAAQSEQVMVDVIGSGEPLNGQATEEPTETPTPTETPPTETPMPGEEPRQLNNIVDWILALIVIAFVSLFAYQFGALAGQIRWGVRWALTSLIGGLAANAYIAFNLPGASLLVSEYHIWGIVLTAAGGCLVGWAAGLLWRYLGR